MTGSAVTTNKAVEVTTGQNGYLYLTGGAQSVLDYVTGRKPITDQAYERFTTNIQARAALASNISARYVHVVCPDKQTVIPEYFPWPIIKPIGRLFEQRCPVPFLFPVDPLRECGTNYGYLKTDTHWNFAGRVAVARAAVSALGIDEIEFQSRLDAILSLKQSHDSFCGDLGSKLEPPSSEAADVSTNPYSLGALRMFSNKIAGNNGLINVIFNLDAPPDRRIVVFGDSFILHSLHMIASFFRETFFLRSPYFHPEIINDFKPTHILTSNAERYLPNTARDADAPLGLLMAGLAGKAWDADVQAYEAINAALQPRGPRNRNFWSDLQSKSKST